MALSNSYSYTETAGQIIQDSYSFLGVLGEGDEISDYEFQLGMRELNRVCKSIQVKNDKAPGMKMWLRHQGYLFLSANTGQYVLNANSGIWTDNFDITNGAGSNPSGTNIIHVANTAGNFGALTIVTSDYINLVLDNNTLLSTRVSNVINTSAVQIATTLPSSFNSQNPIYFFAVPAQPPQVVNYVNLRDGNGFDTYVDIKTYEEFLSLPAKQSPTYQGIPTAVYYESHLVGNGGKGFGYLNTDVDGCTDLTRYLVVNYVRELQDLVSATDEIDMPKEWFLAIVRQLSYGLHPYMDVIWTPQMEQMRMEAVRLAQNANAKSLAYRYSRRKGNSGYIYPHR